MPLKTLAFSLACCFPIGAWAQIQSAEHEQDTCSGQLEECTADCSRMEDTAAAKECNSECEQQLEDAKPVCNHGTIRHHGHRINHHPSWVSCRRILPLPQAL